MARLKERNTYPLASKGFAYDNTHRHTIFFKWKLWIELNHLDDYRNSFANPLMLLFHTPFWTFFSNKMNNCNFWAFFAIHFFQSGNRTELWRTLFWEKKKHFLENFLQLANGTGQTHFWRLNHMTNFFLRIFFTWNFQPLNNNHIFLKFDS